MTCAEVTCDVSKLDSAGEKLSKGEDFATFGEDIPESKEGQERLVQESLNDFYDRPVSLTETDREGFQSHSDTSTGKESRTIRNGSQSGSELSNECKSTTVEYVPKSFPWSEDPRAKDKQRLANYIAKDGHRKTLSNVVSDVFGKQGKTGKDSDYQLAYRLFRNNPEYFSIENRGDLSWIEPTPTLLRQHNVYRRNTRGRKGSNANEKTGIENSEYPKEKVRDFLSNSGTKRIREDSLRRTLIKRFRSWRDSIDGTFSIFESTSEEAPEEYLLVETESRFNSKTEANRSLDRLATALEAAQEKHRQGVMLTVTPQPVRFSTHKDMSDTIREGTGKLKDWLRYRVGHTPESIKVLEYQRQGQPHYHIVLFGIQKVPGKSSIGEPTISEKEVREYWDTELDIGSQIDIQPVRKRGSSWVLHEDSGRVSLSYYLSKSSRMIRDVAQTGATELLEKYENGEIDWRVVLYWAYGQKAQTVSCSPTLKDPDNTDIKEPYWEYVGTAKYRDIPQSITQKAVIRTKDGAPPPTD